MSLPPILVELRASSSQFTSKMGEARQEVSRLGTEGSSHMSKFSTVGKAALVGLASTAAVAAVSIVKSSVGAASDLNESISKTRTVFGNSSKAVEDFASTAARNLGTSKQAALEASATFGNLFLALKLAPPAAADMSTSLVKLAGDLASFNNVDTATALEALRSGILGEAEPLRKFGVSLSAARIETEALAMGLVKPIPNAIKLREAQQALAHATDAAREAVKEHGAKSDEAQLANERLEKAQRKVTDAMQGTVPELTAAQKAQAAYSIIMKDTTTAQGDFARTSDGLANQQRILSATVEDLQAKVGNALLPVMIAVIPYFVRLFDVVGNASGVLTEHKGIATAVGIAIGSVLVVALGTYLTTLAIAIAQTALFGTQVVLLNARVALAIAGHYAAAVASGAWTAAQWLLNAALNANPIGLVVLGIAALAAGLVLAYKKSETFRDIVSGAFDVISDAGKFMWDRVLKPTFSFLLNTWLSVAGAIVHGAASAFGWVPGIGPKLKAAANQFDKFRDEVNASLGGIKDKQIKVTAKLEGYANPQDLSVAHRYAAGTRFAPGATSLVGENGPELVELPGGSKVYTAEETAGRRGGDVTLHAYSQADPYELAHELLWLMKRGAA